MKFTVDTMKKLMRDPLTADDQMETATCRGWLFRMRRTTKGRNACWIFDYPLGDAVNGRRRRRRMTYGRYPAMDVPTARKQAESPVR